MTEKEYYAELIKVCRPGDNDDLVAFCERKIAAIERKAERAKVRAAERREQGDEMTETLRANLEEDRFTTIPDLIIKIGDENITAGKAQYRLNQLILEGAVEKTDMIFRDENQNRRTAKGYKLVKGEA